MDIWNVDAATIRAEIRVRNARRRSALLPLLDEQRELEHACSLIRDERWHAFKESKKADHERFRDEVYAEQGKPNNWISAWGRGVEITKRFEAFLHARFADEIATMMNIVPDYLSITRQVIEATPEDLPDD